MSRKIVLVGHCGPDSSFLRITIRNADASAQVLAADDEQTLQRRLEEGVDLLLFNRQLDWGFAETEGVDVIARLRTQHPNLKMMLVSNFPEAQQAAVNAGALMGFGKRELGSSRPIELIRQALGVATKAT